MNQSGVNLSKRYRGAQTRQLSGLMIAFFPGFLTCFSAFFRSRRNFGLEILALRLQLGVVKRKYPRVCRQNSIRQESHAFNTGIRTDQV